MTLLLDRLKEELTPKLSKDVFLKQIVEHGYFAEQFPECFNSKQLLPHLDKLIELSKCGESQADNKSNVTSPTTYSTKKDDITRRVLSLPNPHAFLRVCNLLTLNWDEVQKYAKSVCSASPITYIHDYDDNGQLSMLNSENARESQRSKSDFIAGLKMSIRKSLGYKYRLKLDVSNCYNSIYTHSIAWAICGKKEAKQYMRTEEPKSMESIYTFADRLDTFTRYLKNNETNGIVVGPYTSRIFSEIILSSIDKKLAEKNYIFTRYVDDYKFYFKTEYKALESIPHIERVLNEYGLHLNTSKTEVSKFPYEIISNMQGNYTDTLKKERVFGVLNLACKLYFQGEKGAFKYALKFIKDVIPCEENFQEIIATLINILLLEPKYGKYITYYLKQHMHPKHNDIITELINSELKFCIDEELEQEALVFMNLLKTMNLEITGENISNILKSHNDFSIIIALDYWKNNNRKVNRSKTEAETINNTITELASNLEGEKYSGSRWLLLHEIKMHKLIKGSLIKVESDNEFFNTLKTLKISFYESFKQ